MIVTLQEDRFERRVRQLENIPDHVSKDEVNHVLDKYATKLFAHLAEYGFTGFDRVSVSGTLGTFRATLVPCRDDESRNTRIAGLAFLDPVSVSLEESDLPAFFRGMLLTAMQDAYSSYAREVQRLTVPELDIALQRIAEQIAFAPVQSPFVIETEEDVETARAIADQEFELFCLRSGVKVPGANRRAVEEFERKRVEEYNAKRARELDQWIRRDGNED